MRAATLTVLLMVNGCGTMFASKSGSDAPGMKAAEAALQGGSAQAALQVSEGILKESPDNFEAREVKADALTLLGQYDEATVIYLSLLSKHPERTRATIGLGRIKLATDPATAEVLFQQVLLREPKNLTALNNLGIARDLLGRHAEAQTAYRQALGLSTDQGPTQVNLALSLAMSGKGEEAIQLLRPRAAEAGATAKMKHDYAVVLAMAGKRAEAEKVLSESMSPEEVRLALDSVTEGRARTVRDTAAEANQRTAMRASGARAQGFGEDATPPDVIQPIPPMRTAARVSDPAPVPVQTPLVVRPRASIEPNFLTGGAPPTVAVAPLAPIPPQVMSLHEVPPGEPRTEAAKPVANPFVPQARPTAPVPAPMTAVPFIPAPAIAKPVAPAIAKPVAPAVTQPVTPAVTQPVAPAPGPAQTRLAIGDAKPVPAEAQAIRFGGGDGPGLVQFTAAPTEAAARSAWQSLTRRFPDVLGRREPIVMRIERGGQVMWRVRADGFETAADARAVCARMRAAGQDCFVPRS